MNTENIHDRIFKHNFKKIEVARAFLHHNLPKKTRAAINLDLLELMDAEFIPSVYRRARRADILYTTQSHTGRDVYTLLHLEGQSHHDKNMALRVWEYHTAIGGEHIKRRSTKIPLIITFVLYHGKAPWTSARSIAELFKDFDLYVEYGLKRPFLKILTTESMEKLKAQGAAAGPQLLLRGQTHGDYADHFQELYPLLKKYDQLDEENLGYMITHDTHREEEFIQKLSKFDAENADKLKTMFERATQRAAQKAHKEGRQEGRQEIIKSLCKQGLLTNDQAQIALRSSL